MYDGSLKRIFLVILFLYSSVYLSFAQGKNFSVNRTSPSWLVKISPVDAQPKTKDINDGYYAALLERQNHVELQEHYLHIIRQIVSDAGVQNGSEISVTYDPSYQKLIFHKLIIWRNNKPYDKLGAVKFRVLQTEKDLSKFIYSGTFNAYLILDDIRKGDRIDFSYTLKGDNPIFENRYADDIYFESQGIVGHMYNNLIANAKRNLHFKNFNFNTPAKVSGKDGLKLYEWESRLTATHRSAEYEPSWYNPFQHTQVTEYESWNEVVNWGLKINSYPDLKTPLIDKKVQELQSAAKHVPKKYIELATRFVQDEIRYMGIEMGTYSHRPNSPERVFKQRYGDCKDKSLLLMYLLNKAGITAFMAYIDTYTGKEMNNFLPSPIIFNHVVVVVEHQRNKIWIDPTISYQRGTSDNIYFPNYGKALVLKPGVTAPEEVISYPNGKLSANLVFSVADTSTTRKTDLVINSIYTDNYADDIRSVIADEGTDGLEKSFLEYITRYYPDIETSSPIKITDNGQTNTITITESYAIKNLWQKEDNKDSKFIAYFYGDLISYNLRKVTAKNRNEPFALKYPVNIEQNILINFPFVSTASDDNFNQETDNYYFEFSSFHKGNGLRLNYSYRGLKDCIDGKDLKQYVKDINKLNENLTYYVTWNGMAGTKKTIYNSYLILASVLIIIITSFYFIRIYQQKNAFEITELINARSIGGPLTLLAIFLPIAPVIIFFQSGNSGLYDLSFWTALEKLGNFYKYVIGFAFAIEFIAWPLRFNWVLLLAFLFFKKREILPQQYTRFIYFSIIIFIFDFLVTCLMNSLMGKPPTNLYVFCRVLIPIAVCIAWALYFKRSQRVRETFVFTYPDSLWRKELFSYYHSKNNPHPQAVMPQTDTAPDHIKTKEDEDI